MPAAAPSWRGRQGDAVRKIFFAHLQAQGFYRTDERARDISGFQRPRRDGGYDLVEIQFDKYARPFFWVHLGIAPAAGVTLPAQAHTAAADVRIYHLALRARLRRKFGLSLLGRLLRGQYICDDLARDAAAQFDAAEKWFADPAHPLPSVVVHDYSDVIARMQKQAEAG